MVRILLTLLVASVLAHPVFPQDSAAPESSKAKQPKTVQQVRLEGTVVRTNPEKKTLTVRQRGSTVEKTVYYDDSTQLVSQEHGSKKANKIDAADIKDNDRVICRGKYDDQGQFHATVISKRLTPL